ncbi:MAG: Dabb family protein [Cyanobacteria bacterium SID2]|nr:Dabb family protein [Cyanobacteria bacterium SID2]MBP0004907.1 Dabb family protein [Cyanobacteria bacterium SBC]
MNVYSILLTGLTLGSFSVSLPVSREVQRRHANSSIVRHIVLVDLKPEVSQAEIDELVEVGLYQLQKIPGVLTLEFGETARDDRPVHIGDYDLAIYMEFENLADLDRYRSHPVHEDFVADYQHLWDGIRVLDFYGQSLDR